MPMLNSSLNQEELYAYSEQYSSPQAQLLNELERETNLTCRQPHMLSGALQGRFLSMISKLKKPSCILEIGTYTGFSALCLAEGLSENGLLHTVEIDEEKQSIIEKYFAQSAYAAQMQLHIGNALEIIPKLGIKPDLVFIDADKINYLNYYQLAKGILAKDGLILIDNVYFHGEVWVDKKSKNAEAVHALNEFILNDEEVELVMVPIRDGISMVRKK
jgi:caffeoyl-CoA O-methyltransferase